MKRKGVDTVSLAFDDSREGDIDVVRYFLAQATTKLGSLTLCWHICGLVLKSNLECAENAFLFLLCWSLLSRS